MKVPRGEFLDHDLTPLIPKCFSSVSCRCPPPCSGTAYLLRSLRWPELLRIRCKAGSRCQAQERSSRASGCGASPGAGRSSHLPGEGATVNHHWGGVRMRVAGRGGNVLPSTVGAAQLEPLCILALHLTAAQPTANQPVAFPCKGLTQSLGLSSRGRLCPENCCACSCPKPGVSKQKAMFASSGQGFEGFPQPQELLVFISPAQSL